MNDEGDCFTLLTGGEGGAERFLCGWNSICIYRITNKAGKKSSDCNLLQITRDSQWHAMAMRYLCVHCSVSVFVQTDNTKVTKVPVTGSHRLSWVS